MNTPIRFALALALGALLALPPGAARAQATAMPPLAAGSSPVGCTNIAQNLSGLSDDVRKAYWEGTPSQYVTDILAAPADALQTTIAVPADRRDLFPYSHGRQIRLAILVCYPTRADNTRPDYPVSVDGSRAVPRMQRAGEAPLWADALARYPLLLYAHGLNASPLSTDHLETLVRWAAYGYVVAAPFFGDPRFADTHIDNLADAARLFFLGYGIELQAMRPLALQATLDTVLAHRDFGERIDSNRIGGFGVSLGGESLLLLAGGALTVDFTSKRSLPVTRDTRLVAAAGYVPYFGQPFLPAFGDNQLGLQGLTLPYLGISGTADTTAPITQTEQGINQLAGSRYLVAIQGLGHELRQGDLPDILTWSQFFFAAHLLAQPGAREQLAGMAQVAGGASDSLRVSVTQAASRFPRLTATPAGSPANLDLTGHVGIAAADLGQAGKIYVVANAQGLWLARDDSGWHLWTGGALPARFSGTLADQSIEIVRNLDATTLAGTQVYLGYGLSEIDMFANGKYRLIYTVPASR